MDLLIYLGEHSFTQMDHWQKILKPINNLAGAEYFGAKKETRVGANFGPRPSDEPADMLLVKFFQRLDVEESAFSLERHTNTLRHTIKYLSNFCIGTYFKTSFLHLDPLFPERNLLDKNLP